MKLFICLIMLVLIIKEIKSLNSSEFVLQLSLEHRSLIQVAVNWWEREDTINKMKIAIPRLFYAGSGVPSIVAKEVLRDSPQCIKNSKIPKQFRKQLPEVMYGVGERTMTFLLDAKRSLGQVHEAHPSLNDYIDNIRYSDFGLIIKSQTIKAIFNNINKKYPREDCNNQFLFIEACKYCSEMDIKLIWNKLTDEEKSEIDEAATDTLNYSDLPGFNPYTTSLVFYWGSHLNFFQSNNPVITSFEISKDVFQRFSERMFLYEDIETFKYFLNTVYSQDDREKDFLLDQLIGLAKHSRFPDNVENWIISMQQIIYIKRFDCIQSINTFTWGRLIKSWPWRYLYIDIFDLSIQLTGEMTKTVYENSLSFILVSIIDGFNIPQEIGYLSGWLIRNFIEKYRHPLYDNTPTICWKSSSEYESKMRGLIFYKIYFGLERIEPEEIRQDIIGVSEGYRWYLETSEEWDLIYQIQKHILVTAEERYDYMMEFDIDCILKHFMEKHERYDIADELFDATYKNDKDKIKKHKFHTYWPDTVRNVIKKAESKDDINNKLYSLFEWFGFLDTQKTQLLTCIQDDLSVYDRKDWEKISKCLKKTAKTFIV